MEKHGKTSSEHILSPVSSVLHNQADYVVCLGKLFQQHTTCSSYCSEAAEVGEVCKQYYPRVPALYWHLALRPKLTTNLDWAWFKSAQNFFSAFKIQEGPAQRPRQPGGVTS